MSAIAERDAQELIYDTFDLIYSCLGIPAAALDEFDAELDALVAFAAEEIDMWLSAAVAMADWTYPIGVES